MKKLSAKSQENNDLTKASETVSTKKSGKKLSLLSLADKLLQRARNSQLSKEFFSENKSIINKIAESQAITPLQAVLLIAIFEMSSHSRVDIDDLSRFFDISTIGMLSYTEDLEVLLERKFIRRTSNNDVNGTQESYSLSGAVVEAFKQNKAFVPADLHCDNTEDFFAQLDEWYSLRDDNELSANDHVREIRGLFNENQHLPFVQAFKANTQKLTAAEKSLLLLFCMLFVKNDDNEVYPRQWNFIFDVRLQARRLANALADGTSPLMSQGLVDYSNNEGRAMNNAYCLTDYAKQVLLPDIVSPSGKLTSNRLLSSEKIVEKKLFYNKEEQRQIDQMAALLQQEKYVDVCKNLEKKGMRQGICCLLHGSPGTGKTETVLQLAKASGRDIFRVDLAQMRSKWVGDSEKEVQAMFDEYASCVRKSEIAPILLINEADGILTTRMHGAERSVDKMENTMQNIFLQNMEDMKGILIATTNLADNLDPAFERRFLFKVKYDKPNVEAKKQIWLSMMPELSEEDAQRLAGDFDFSGGQIENICRKKTINEVLSNADTNFEQLRQYCRDEQIKKDANGRPIGFGN
ncbi:MAG: ATP-binding protein [Bacteroidales bacterium]|nr:ATP-binding protein [Bacteroidales bacterium]